MQRQTETHRFAIFVLGVAPFEVLGQRFHLYMRYPSALSTAHARASLVASGRARARIHTPRPPSQASTHLRVVSLQPQPPLLRAVAQTVPHIATILDPVHCARRTWHRGIVHLRAALIRLQREWPAVVRDGAQCPLRFTEEEARRTEVERARAVKYRRVMMEARAHGIGEDGEVEAAAYPRAQWLNEWVKTQWGGGEVEGGPFPHVDGGRSFQV